MADIKVEQAVAMGALGTVSGATTSEADLAGKMRTALAKSKPLEALEIGRREPIQDEDIEKAKAEIGTKRNDITGKKELTGDEPARVNSIDIAAKDAKAFADKGYDALSAGQKTTLENMVKAVVATRPALKTQYEALLAAGQGQQAIVDLLRNPLVSTEVRNILREVLAHSKLADAVTPAETSMQMAQIDRDTANQDLQDTNNRLQPIDQQLKEFERPTTGSKGKKADDLDKLRNNSPQTQTELTLHEGNLQSLNDRLTRLTTERARAVELTAVGKYAGRPIAEIDNEIDTQVKPAIKAEEGEVSRRKTDLKKLEQLENQERTLQEKKAQLEQEKKQKEADFKKKELIFKQKQQDYQDALRLRGSQEDDLVHRFENVTTEALNNVLDNEINLLHAELNRQLDVMKTEAKTANEQAIADGLKSELSEVKSRKRWYGTEKYVAIKKVNTENYYATLMTEGPKGAMRELLKSQINPATKAKYTDAEADALLKDQAYVDKMQPQVISQILARKLMVSGISRGDAYAIKSTEWGSNMLAKAQEFNKEYEKEIAALKESGALNEPGFLTQIAYRFKNHPWLLIAIMVGALAVPGGLLALGTLAATGAGAAVVSHLGVPGAAAAVGGGTFIGATAATGIASGKIETT